MQTLLLIGTGNEESSPTILKVEWRFGKRCRREKKDTSWRVECDCIPLADFGLELEDFTLIATHASALTFVFAILEDLGGDTSRPVRTNATTHAELNARIEQLSRTLVAVTICLAILRFLLLTTVNVLYWYEGYLHLLPRDVESIGSILRFVYISETLLDLLADNGSLKGRNKRSEFASMG
jgi:hypothetical protein